MKLVTYNIQYSKGKDGRYDLGRIAEAGGVTYPTDGDSPDKRLDYCFVSAALADRVRSAHVDMAAEGSDHQPVWVDMEM